MPAKIATTNTMNKDSEVVFRNSGNTLVWHLLRYGFFGMIALFIIFLLSTALRAPGLSMILFLLFYASTWFVFINSIRHLVYYEKESFAIVAMIVSFFALIICTAVFAYVVIQLFSYRSYRYI